MAPAPPEPRTSSRRIGGRARLGALWLLTGRLTHPPFVGSRRCLTKPRKGDAGGGWAATLRVSEKGVWGRSPRHLDCEGGGGRNRLLSLFRRGS